jgi:hypothetical protein
LVKLFGAAVGPGFRFRIKEELHSGIGKDDRSLVPPFRNQTRMFVRDLLLGPDQNLPHGQ